MLELRSGLRLVRLAGNRTVHVFRPYQANGARGATVCGRRCTVDEDAQAVAALRQGVSVCDHCQKKAVAAGEAVMTEERQGP